MVQSVKVLVEMMIEVSQNKDIRNFAKEFKYFIKISITEHLSYLYVSVVSSKLVCTKLCKEINHEQENRFQ
jgi:hypothetical protein